MSAKTSSPTAALLRSSRVFSMPRPLPLPQSDLLGHVQSNRNSDSATLPYPIQQAIATTPSALYRGDWGLKRPLPLRSTTRTSTPIFRLNAIDTREHITDFASASDLTLNLKKIQELGLSVTSNPMKTRKSYRNARHNVFDPQLDNTAMGSEDGAMRWKFKGPWVAGMTQGDFEAFINHELKDRKAEFNTFLRTHAANAIAARKLAEARHEGYDATRSGTIRAAEGVAATEIETETQTQSHDPSTEDPETPSRPSPATSAEIDTYILTLRQSFALGSELAILLQTFLDLPAVAGSALENYHQSFYEQGPPKTHPSAGLTYLRSDAFLDNHALFGPQKVRPPIEARLLASSFRATSNPNDRSGRIGVAGVVTLESTGPGRKIRSIPDLPHDDDMLEFEDRKLNNVGLGTPGGNRMWVQATSLGLNSRGRINLKTAIGDSVAVGVHTGALAGPIEPITPKRPVVKPLDGFDASPERQTDGFGARSQEPARRTGPQARPSGSSAYGFNDRDDGSRQRGGGKRRDETSSLMEFLEQDSESRR